MTKPISRKMAVDCLLHRVIVQHGLPLFCDICHEPLVPGQQIQFDHIHSDVMGGKHEYQNLRPVHYDPCHKKKSARDVAAKAKLDRITHKTKTGPKAKIRSGRKLQSRNTFPPKGTVPMRKKP